MMERHRELEWATHDAAEAGQGDDVKSRASTSRRAEQSEPEQSYDEGEGSEEDVKSAPRSRRSVKDDDDYEP